MPDLFLRVLLVLAFTVPFTDQERMQRRRRADD